MSENNQTVRVLVVDDQQIIQEGISTILSYQEGIEVVGVANNGQAAIEQALRLQPDVILMDVRMPVMDGVAAAAQLRQQLPTSRILMLTTFDDEEYVLEALRVGATGYLLKDIPGRELAQAIRSVKAGLYQLDPSVATRVIANLNRPLPDQPPPAKPVKRPEPKIDLTEREIEILRLIASGATNREISQQLVITEGTVKNHVSNILTRLNLRDRTQAALFAREQGLL